MKNTRVSNIVCFTILALPVLLDEEYWSFQYRVFYNTSITSIVGWRIPVLCIDQRFWYSSIVNAQYWYILYCIYTILDCRYFNITILVFLVLYSVSQYWYYQYCWMKNTGASSIVCFTILVLPVLMDVEYWSFQYCVFYNTSITSIAGWRILEFPVLCALQY